MKQKDYHLLLIEDDLDDAKIVTNLLKQIPLNIIITHISIQSEFIEKMDGCFDLIISDFYLGEGFNGIDVINYVRKGNYNLPIIIVSGVLGDETAAETIKMGANDYLLKDNYHKLPKKVLKHLQANRAIVTKEVYKLPNVGIFILNESGKFLYLNDFMKQMLHCDVNTTELGFKSINIYAKDNYMFQSRFFIQLTKHKKFQLNFRVVLQDKQIVWLKTHFIPDFKDDTFKCYLGSCIDITQFKEIQKVLKWKKIELKLVSFCHDVLSTVSHSKQKALTLCFSKISKELNYVIASLYLYSCQNNHYIRHKVISKINY